MWPELLLGNSYQRALLIILLKSSLIQRLRSERRKAGKIQRRFRELVRVVAEDRGKLREITLSLRETHPIDAENKKVVAKDREAELTARDI